VASYRKVKSSGLAEIPIDVLIETRKSWRDVSTKKKQRSIIDDRENPKIKRCLLMTLSDSLPNRGVDTNWVSDMTADRAPTSKVDMLIFSEAKSGKKENVLARAIHVTMATENRIRTEAL